MSRMTEIRPARTWTLALMGGMLGTLLILALGMVQFRSVQAESLVRAEVSQRENRLLAVTRYLWLLRDVESGQRGLILTGNSDFLQPFDRAMGSRQDVEDRLSVAYPAGNSEHGLATQLIGTGRRRIAFASGVIDDFQAGNPNKALAEVRSGLGKALMGQASDLAAKLESKESAKSRKALAVATERRLNQQRAIFVLEALILAALLIMAVGLIRAIQSLSKRGRQLYDAALRQSAIFEGATDAMLMLDPIGTIESMNGAAERLFGRARTEAIGQSHLILFAKVPTVEASIRYLALLAAGDRRVDSKQVFTGIRADQSTLEAEVVTTPIPLQDGKHFLAVARDITARLEIERMKNEFVATVSHELRTPLTSIAGSLGLLSGGAAGDLPAKSARLIEIALSNTKRLIRLINDMLDLEKIESGQMRLDLRAISLGPFLRTVTQANQAFALSHKVKVKLECCPPEWSVFADHDRLFQVVTNLLSNAIKFSPESGTVTLFAEDLNGRFRINVRDRGAGIDEEFRARIFTKFAQADSTTKRVQGGTGLGLNIVQELVRRMNGSVGFDSEPGIGSTFYVELPPAPKSDSKKTVKNPEISIPSKAGLPHLLHVEDDPDMLRLVESAFEGRAVVFSTPSVREAHAALERHFFDAIILDIAMPDGNGLDLMPQIRSSERPVSVILFTALDAAADETRDIQARLTKSKSSLNELVATVERSLKNLE